MADTIRGEFPKQPCSDCGEVGKVYIQHWGLLVPNGSLGYFCPTCLGARAEDSKAGKEPRPLGQTTCQECDGTGNKFVVDRVVQGQNYGPESQGHNELCRDCNGSGKKQLVTQLV